MGVVDVSDQKREYSGVGRSSKKWWMFILHFFLNVCLVSYFIIYDLKNHPPSLAHRNRQLIFRRNLVRLRIGTFTSGKRTGRKRNLPIGTAFHFHTLQKISGRAKVYALCKGKKKKLHQEGLNRQNINESSENFHCAVCGVFWNTTSSQMWRCKIR